ncbi:transmembrane emp24 domain-containing protein 5-like [Saccostrea echinata]|uniref:transmembrane emp24 domain-containing protein 5-like n=1 Tax=Saccostrea echinata TaxID=191078 RepID=UPI002A8298F0|nr:transmembrane emp24 domain-containing protein 5-like [Saccostrea echinata]
MATSITSILLLFVISLLDERVFVCGIDEGDFDYDALPGTQHEFKIEVKAGDEDCFAQKVALGAVFHVQYEVLRGGDRTIRMIVIDPSLKTIQHEDSKSEGFINHKATMEGYHHVCIDNTHSRFSGKLVYIHIVTYIMEEWAKYMEEIQSVSLTVQNFSRSLTDVQTSVDTVRFHQSESRMHVVRDWYLAIGNNKHIMYWSIFQISIIMMTSVFQIFCLRRLFSTTAVTPSQKPRA